MKGGLSPEKWNKASARCTSMVYSTENKVENMVGSSQKLKTNLWSTLFDSPFCVLYGVSLYFFDKLQRTIA